MNRFILINTLLILPFLKINCQVINYVNNGSFEEVVTSTSTPLLYYAKFWGATDTTQFFGETLSRTTVPIKVPLCSYTYQWPKSGNNDIISLQYCPTCPSNKRGYPRNRLKQLLKSNTAYCLSFYVNLSNNSSYGIDAIGCYLSDNSTDTINVCNRPITYLTPQVQNSVNNIITDTLGWTLIRGSFIANGTEKYLMIGNFKSDTNTNKLLVNPMYLPTKFTDYLFDDVSLIELNLPAFAGRDTSVAPGTNIFLGRQPDVGIDEACIWYKLPSTIPIDTIAGFWVNPTSTSTYVVVQTICGLIKSDTVVVHMDLVGIDELKIKDYKLKIYPQPADEILIIESLEHIQPLLTNLIWQIEITNSLGQIILSEEVKIKENKIILNAKKLEVGIYFLNLKSSNSGTVSKRFVIVR